MPPSDAKAAYEAVATRLKTPHLTTAADTFELPYRVAPRLYVDTLRKALAWPLAVHEVDQLAVAYTLSPGVVLLPAMSARVDNTNAWRKTLTRIETVVRDVLSPTSPFRLALAHVAFDATGSSACLTPALRPPHTIGTVVISLPTFHRGGDVMFADGRSYCTQHATTTYVCAVFAPNANYLIEPMTYGRRVTLVYHVVAATDPVKANIDAATATLQSLAAAPSHALNVFALRPTAPTAPGVEGLAPDDRAFADALVETDVYDVALINKAHPGRPAEGRKVSATTVGVALPHGNSLCHVTVDAILFTDAGVDVRCIPGQWLIFWRKSFRVQLADAASVVATLVAAVAPGAVHSIETLLGQSDLRALVQALLHRLPKSSMDISQSVELTDAFCKTLLYLGDRALVVHFVRQHWSHIDVVCTAPHVPRFCAALGWEYLGPAFLCMLRRWCATSAGISASYELVTSLAGVSHRPICEPVSQPFVAELYLDARALLLNVIAHWDVEDDSLGPNCTHGLQLEAYAQQHALQGRWLYNRLPDPIVALVSSYLTPAVRLLDVTDGVLYHPLYDLGVALGILAAQNVAMDLLPYAARVIYAVMLDDYDGDDVRYSVEAVVGLVVAGDCANILESVLSRCLHDRGIAVVPALVAFARQCPRLVTPAFCAMASATILDATCSNRPVRPVMDDVLAAYFDANERCAGHDTRMLVLVCALEYFRTYDRATVLGFVDMWLAGNGDLNLHYEWTMYLTSTLSVDDGDVLVRLGLAYIEVTPYCPKVYTDYCLDDVAFAPTCCAYCVEFGRFLLSPVDAYRRCYAHQVCDAISDVVAAHPLQLQATTLRGLEILGEIALDTDGTGYALADPAIVIDFVKVRQPGQLSLRELCLRLEHLDTTTTSTMRRRRRMEELVTRTRAALAHRRETFVE